MSSNPFQPLQPLQHRGFVAQPASVPTSLIGGAVRPAYSRKLGISEASQAKATMTRRQQEVLFCLVEGKPTKRICTELGISEGTAKVHIAAIFRTLQVRNRTEATLAAIRSGWIQPEMWSRA
jgi:DNA-binding NarL/FixJ family response regulator